LPFSEQPQPLEILFLTENLTLTTCSYLQKKCQAAFDILLLFQGYGIFAREHRDFAHCIISQN